MALSRGPAGGSLRERPRPCGGGAARRTGHLPGDGRLLGGCPGRPRGTGLAGLPHLAGARLGTVVLPTVMRRRSPGGDVRDVSPLD